jgi:hypothetical protein
MLMDFCSGPPMQFLSGVDRLVGTNTGFDGATASAGVFRAAVRFFMLLFCRGL